MQALHDGLVSTVFSKNVHSDFFLYSSQTGCFCHVSWTHPAHPFFRDWCSWCVVLSPSSTSNGYCFTWFILTFHLLDQISALSPMFISQKFFSFWIGNQLLHCHAYIRNIAYDCFSFLVSCLSIPNRCFIFIILIHTKYLANACQLYKHLKSLIVLCLWNWWYDKGPCWTKAACYWSPENVSLPHTDFLTSSNQTNAIKALLN